MRPIAVALALELQSLHDVHTFGMMHPLWNRRPIIVALVYMYLYKCSGAGATFVASKSGRGRAELGGPSGVRIVC